MYAVHHLYLLGTNSAVQMQPLWWGGRRPVILQTASTRNIIAGHSALIPSTECRHDRVVRTATCQPRLALRRCCLLALVASTHGAVRVLEQAVLGMRFCDPDQLIGKKRRNRLAAARALRIRQPVVLVAWLDR